MIINQFIQMSLTLSSFKRCFDLLTLEDQKVFISDLPEMKKLKKDYEKAMKEGELLKYVCACGNYLIFHPNIGRYDGVPDYESGGNLWKLDAKIGDYEDYEWLEDEECYVFATPRNQNDIDLGWDKRRCARAFCPNCVENN